MSAVFISYRRGDSAGHTGRLYDHLREQFGQETIFRDIDTIEPGADFSEAVKSGLKDCSTAVIVIGQNWLDAVDGNGKRRLDDPNDFVRIEIATALKSNIRVIPVLVNGATMPATSQLPEEISALSRRHALELSDSRWEYDINRLIETLSGILNKSEKVERFKDNQREGRKKPGSRRTPILLLLASFALVVFLAMLMFVNKEAEVKNDGGQDTNRKTDITPQVLPKNEENEENEDSFSSEQKINQLLNNAKLDINSNRLTLPEGNNAREKYREVLEINPSEARAISGLETIAKTYLKLAKKAIDSGRVEKAEEYVGKAGKTAPNLKAVESFLSEIEILKEQKIQLEKQRKSENDRKKQLRQQELDKKLAREKKAREKLQRENQLIEMQKLREAEEKRIQEELRLEQSRKEDTLRQKNLALEKQKKARREACLTDCEKKLNSCSIKTNQNEFDDCQSTIKTVCDEEHDACLSDPQIYILWGDHGAESECMGRWTQCKDDKAKDCDSIKINLETLCVNENQSCIQACQY